MNWSVPAWLLWGLTKKFTLASHYIYIYSDAFIESDKQVRRKGRKETRANTEVWVSATQKWVKEAEGSITIIQFQASRVDLKPGLPFVCRFWMLRFTVTSLIRAGGRIPKSFRHPNHQQSSCPVSTDMCCAPTCSSAHHFPQECLCDLLLHMLMWQ